MVGDKEYFVRHFNVLNEFWWKTLTLQRALNKTFMDGGVVTFGNELMASHIEMLSESCGIDKETIEWVLFEGGGKATFKDAEYDVTNAEQLWNFYKMIK